MPTPTKAGPSIEDRPFQILCFGRYNPPAQQELSEWQKIAFSRYKKVGHVGKTASLLGITNSRMHSILKAVKSKGYDVDIPES